MTAGERTELAGTVRNVSEEPSRSEERIRQRDSPDDGTRHVAFVPLVTGELRRHRRVAAQDHHEAADAFAHERVFILMWHCARTDLALGESPVTNPWPTISRIVFAQLDGADANCTSAPGDP